jgi:hypothetical protein
MFNVECNPQRGKEYVDCDIPLWEVRRTKKKKRRDRGFADNIKPGISTNEPGTNFRVIQANGTTSRISARADDLRKFYEFQEGLDAQSAFDEEEVGDILDGDLENFSLADVSGIMRKKVRVPRNRKKKLAD